MKLEFSNILNDEKLNIRIMYNKKTVIKKLIEAKKIFLIKNKKITQIYF